jgi:hypothetical protein
MTPSILFSIGLAVSLVTSLAVVVYLRAALQRILVELCGTSERARFWAAFTNISVVLVPLIFALQYSPELKEGQPAVLEIAAQLKWALAGLLATVVMVGWVLSRFTRQWPPANTRQSSGEAH